MLFSNVFAWFLIAVGFVVALPALWLLARGLWPASALKMRQAAAGNVVLSFLLGLIPVVGGTIAAIAISKLPQMGLLAVLFGGVLLAWGFLGAGGIAQLIGERLWEGAEPWRQTLRGGAVLICCALLPVIGWVVLLPMIAVVGWGINLRSWFIGRSAAIPAPETAPAIAPASM